MPQERLHKVMANAGIASRRECEEIIAAGRVTVNDKVVTQMGVKVDPQRDQIKVDGEPIKPRLTPGRKYIMLYKPVGYLSVFSDERGRPGLEALVSSDDRLFPVGRLDADSEGLLLLTNDGEMAQRLSHPRYEHAKTYVVLVDHLPGMDTLNRFRRGMELEDGVTAPSEWRTLDRPPVVPPPEDPAAAEGVWLQVTLREGRKRQIRRMCAAEHLYVRRLIRISQGPLQLDPKLQPGASRPLRNSEVQSLRSVTRDKPAGPKQPPATGAGERPTGPRVPRQNQDMRPRTGQRPAGATRPPRPPQGAPKPSSTAGSRAGTSTAAGKPAPARGAAVVSRAAIGPTEKPALRRGPAAGGSRRSGSQPRDLDEREAPRRGPGKPGPRPATGRRVDDADRPRSGGSRPQSRPAERPARRSTEGADRQPAAGPRSEGSVGERHTPRRRPADPGSASGPRRGPSAEGKRPPGGRPSGGAGRKPSGGSTPAAGSRSAPRRAPRGTGPRDSSRSAEGRSDQRPTPKPKKQQPRKP